MFLFHSNVSPPTSLLFPELISLSWSWNISGLMTVPLLALDWIRKRNGRKKECRWKGHLETKCKVNTSNATLPTLYLSRIRWIVFSNNWASSLICQTSPFSFFKPFSPFLQWFNSYTLPFHPPSSLTPSFPSFLTLQLLKPIYISPPGNLRVSAKFKSKREREREREREKERKE